MPEISHYANIIVTPAHELHYTEQTEFFSTLDTESLQINHRKFCACLKNEKYVDKWPEMQLSRQLIEDVLKERGIEIIVAK